MTEPYYSDELVTLYHGDCRDVVADLPSGASVVTDSPYGVGLAYDEHDDSEENLRDLIGALAPILLNGDSHGVFTGVQNFSLWPRPRWTLCWIEPAGTRSGPWGFSTWQPIAAYGPDPFLATGRGRRPDTFRTAATSAKNEKALHGTGDHPCPKPISVMTWAVERITLPTATVVDPFAGSGSTLVAAKRLGRKAIGVELSERYCEIAAKRLAQGVLDFGGAS